MLLVTRKSYREIKRCSAPIIDNSITKLPKIAKFRGIRDESKASGHSKRYKIIDRLTINDQIYKTVSKEIKDLTNYFIKNFCKMNIMSKGSIKLVPKYDKNLARAVKSSVHAFTYYWPTWPENVGKIPKGFAIYLDHKLVQENHSILRDIFFTSSVTQRC